MQYQGLYGGTGLVGTIESAYLEASGLGPHALHWEYKAKFTMHKPPEHEDATTMKNPCAAVLQPNTVMPDIAFQPTHHPLEGCLEHWSGRAAPLGLTSPAQPLGVRLGYMAKTEAS